MRISLSVPESCAQEILNYAGALPSSPTLPCRHLRCLYPYAAVERSSAPMSPLSKPQHWPLGHIPLPPRPQTLPLQSLPTDIQRPHTDVVGPEQAVTRPLAPRNLSVVPVLLVASHCQGGRCPYPHELSLVLVAAQYCRSLRDRSPVGGHG